MNITVLGCAGGIGGRERHTTCLWLDEDILFDAGTGLTQLDLEQLVGIEHVFLTHCHLDHVAGLALLLDAISGKKRDPVTVHASRKVIDSLQKHLFNWILWPDFSTIPSAEHPILRWEAIETGEEIEIDGRLIVAHTVNHTTGSLAYAISQEQKGLLFTGDMCTTPGLWEMALKKKNIGKIIIDCSFPDAEFDLAAKSMHFCPASLIEDVRKITEPVEFLIYHLKPGQEDVIMDELNNIAGINLTFKALKNLDQFVL